MFRWLQSWFQKLWTTDRQILTQTQELMRQLIRIELETDEQLARMEHKIDRLVAVLPSAAATLIIPTSQPTDQPTKKEK